MTNRAEILAFARQHRLAVLATTAWSGAPQAALVGVAVTDALELVFDTLATSRKYANLRANPRTGFVLGWEGAATLQYEGLAEELRGDPLDRYKRIYFAAWPDGVEREGLPDIAYFRVRPTWLRFSDFGAAPPRIVEMTMARKAERQRTG